MIKEYPDNFHRELELIRSSTLEKALSQDVFYVSPLVRKKIYDLAKKYREEVFVLALDLIIVKRFKSYVESIKLYQESNRVLNLMNQTLHQPNRNQLQDWQQLAENLWSTNELIDENNREYLFELYGEDCPETIRKQYYFQGMSTYMINMAVFRFSDLWWSDWDGGIFDMTDNFAVTYDVLDVALLGALIVGGNPNSQDFNSKDHHDYWIWWLEEVIPEAFNISRKGISLI